MVIGVDNDNDDEYEYDDDNDDDDAIEGENANANASIGANKQSAAAATRAVVAREDCRTILLLLVLDIYIYIYMVVVDMIVCYKGVVSVCSCSACWLLSYRVSSIEPATIRIVSTNFRLVVAVAMHDINNSTGSCKVKVKVHVMVHVRDGVTNLREPRGGEQQPLLASTTASGCLQRVATG